MAKRYFKILLYIFPALLLMATPVSLKGQCPVIPSFSFTNTCLADYEISFTNSSTAPGGQIASYLWDFGDGNTSTVQDPVHAYLTPGSYSVYLFVYDTSGCYDSIFQAVSPSVLPVADFSWDTACSTLPMQFTDLSTSPDDPIISWSWSFGDGNTSTLQNPVHTYAMGGIMFVSLDVTTQSGCFSSITQNVSVYFPPTADFSFTPTCWEDTTYFSDQSTLAGPGQLNYWFWDFGDGNTSTLQNPSHYYPLPGDYSVTLTIADTNNCTSVVNKVVSVNMPPQADFLASEACEGSATFFTDLSFGNPSAVVSWDWDFGDGSTSTTQNPNYLYTAAGFYNVTLTVTDQNGCTDVYSDSVLVNQNPVATFIADTACLGDPTIFTDNSLPAGQINAWSWDFGEPASGGNNFSFLQNPVHTYLTAGTYTVTLSVTDVNGCQNTGSSDVYVEPLPIPNFTFINQACLGEVVLFTDLSLPGGEPINMWIWAYGDGTYDTIYAPANPNGAHAYNSNGLKDVTLTVVSAYGCEASITKQLNIVPAPTADFTYTGDCENMSTQFSDVSSTNGGSPVISWWWDFGDILSGGNNNSTLQNPGHIFSGPGNYNVTLIAFNGNACSDTIVKTVNVSPAPPVDFYFDAACEGLITQFYSDPSVINLSTVTAFLWDFGDGGFSNLQDPIHTYLGSGTYNVSLTITDTALCENTVIKTVEVDEPPIAFFDITEPTCNGDSVFFDDLSSTTFGFIQTWVWDFDDGSPIDSIHFPDDPNVYHIFNSTGTYGVTLTVINSQGCIHSYTRNVTIDGKPIANFHWSANPCEGEEVQFTDNSFANGQGNIITWEWNFDDPMSGANNSSILQNPVHVFTEGGTFYVRLIVTNFNDCQDTMIKAVTVNETPDVAFLWDNPCEDTLTYFYPDSSIMNPSSVTSWLWEFGDGQTSTDPSPAHKYEDYGYYNVTLTVLDTGVCTNSITQEIFVNATPIALFEVSDVTCQNNPVYFSDLSSVSNSYVTEWHWDFGDGTDTTIYFPDDPDVSHTFDFDGTYLVTLNVVSADSCFGVGSEYVVIDPAPIAMFNYESACDGSPTQFWDNSSLGGGLTIAEWYWDFGDPISGPNNFSSLQNPVHQYDDPGTYLVTLVVTNVTSCPDSIVQEVVVNSGAPVDFYSIDTCHNLFTEFFVDPDFTDTSAIILYDWDFGDGSLHSNLMNPVHMYDNAGIYDVTLIVHDTSGCSNAVTHSTEVRANPIALFEYEAACTSDTTFFTDLSYTINGDLIVAWEWDFGDGATSTLQHPTHIYASSSSFEVKLVITTEYGCQDSIISPITVLNGPDADYSYNVDYCSSGLVYFQDLSTYTQTVIIDWDWYFEPGSYSNIPNPFHVFTITDTTYDVRLIVKDANGCTDVIIQSIYVPPGFEIEMNNSLTCFQDPMFFGATVLQPAQDSIFSYNWNFGEPASGPFNTSTLAEPQHTYLNPGYYTVSLTARDIYGCEKTIYQTVYVNELPIPAFDYEVEQCDSILHFTDLSSGNGAQIQSWLWDFGDGTPPEFIQIPPGNTQHFYGEEGTYMVKLTITNDLGCVQTDSMEVEMKPCLYSEFEVLNSPVCERNNILFSDYSGIEQLIDQWYWDFGDGADTIYQSKSDTISHYYEMAGDYDVRLIVSAVFNGQAVSDTIFETVSVNPTPVPEFYCTPVCFGETSEFFDSTAHPGYFISSWHYDFGTGMPGDTSSERNPVFKYDTAGFFDVTMTTVNQYGCVDSITKEVVVDYLPIANFEYSLACEGDPIYFTDLSDGFNADIVSWSWYFNDPYLSGDTSNMQNPSWIYAQAGSNTVDLVVRNENGCRDTASYDVLVNTVPEAGFTLTYNYDNMQGSILLEDTSHDAVDYLWNFGDSYEMWDNNPPITHVYEDEGEFVITQIIWNEFGCTDTAFMEFEFIFKTLYIPNALAPSGNDPEVQVFKPKGRNLREFYIAVHDTWGNILWESDKLDSQGRPVESWDGTYNGTLMPTDVYIWRANAIFIDGTIWEGSVIGNNDGSPGKTHGSVTLVR